MNINLQDVGKRACAFAGEMLLQGGLSEQKILDNPVGFSPQNRTYVANMITGAIELYHSALREALLKQGIDIGGFNDIDDEN